MAEAGTLMKQYFDLRDRQLKDLEAEYKMRKGIIEKKMTALEQKFVKAFNKQVSTKEHPQTTVSNDLGSVYRDIRVSLRVTDQQAFTDWVLEDPENRIGYMECRVSKLATLGHLETEELYTPTKKNEPLDSYDAEPLPGLALLKEVRAKFSTAPKKG